MPSGGALTVASDASLVRMPFDAWHDAVSEAFVPLEARTHEPPSFVGRLGGSSLGELDLAYVDGSPVTVSRTPRTIRSADRGYLKVGVQLRGYCVLTQDGREAALTPGDLGIYDTSRPYELVFERDFRMLVLMLPRQLLTLRERQVHDLTARRISGRRGMGAVLAPFLTELGARALAGEITPSIEVCDAVLDLLAATCRSAEQPHVVDHPEAAHDAFLLRVHAYIDEHLADRDLDTASIAAAHNVSLRYLQKLFQRDGTTVTACVRRRRLDRCRRDLADPRLRHVPVAAVGARWGYADAANFARAFRAEYGAAPSDLRDQR